MTPNGTQNPAETGELTTAKTYLDCPPEGILRRPNAILWSVLAALGFACTVEYRIHVNGGQGAVGAIALSVTTATLGALTIATWIVRRRIGPRARKLLGQLAAPRDRSEPARKRQLLTALAAELYQTRGTLSPPAREVLTEFASWPDSGFFNQGMKKLLNAFPGGHEPSGYRNDSQSMIDPPSTWAGIQLDALSLELATEVTKSQGHCIRAPREYIAYITEAHDHILTPWTECRLTELEQALREAHRWCTPRVRKVLGELIATPYDSYFENIPQTKKILTRLASKCGVTPICLGPQIRHLLSMLATECSTDVRAVLTAMAAELDRTQGVPTREVAGQLAQLHPDRSNPVDCMISELLLSQLKDSAVALLDLQPEEHEAIRAARGSVRTGSGVARPRSGTAGTSASTVFAGSGTPQPASGTPQTESGTLQPASDTALWNSGTARLASSTTRPASGIARAGSAAGSDTGSEFRLETGHDGSEKRGLLRLGRLKPELAPEVKVPTTKVVRQQPVRQARSKRLGKRSVQGKHGGRFGREPAEVEVTDERTTVRLVDGEWCRHPMIMA